MHSADYAVARCLSVCLSVSVSVCPSVTRRYSVETAIYIINSIFFTNSNISIPNGTSVFRRGPPDGVLECSGGDEKITMLDQ